MRVEGLREGEELGELPESVDVTRLTPVEGGFLATVDIVAASGKIVREKTRSKSLIMACDQEYRMSKWFAGKRATTKNVRMRCAPG